MASDFPAGRIHRLLRRFAVAQAVVTVVLIAEAVLLFRSGSRAGGALTLGFAASTLWAAWFMRRVGTGVATVGCRVRTKRRKFLIHSLVATWLAFVGTLTAVRSGAEGLLTTFGPGLAFALVVLIVSRRLRQRLASG